MTAQFLDGGRKTRRERGKVLTLLVAQMPPRQNLAVLADQPQLHGAAADIDADGVPAHGVASVLMSRCPVSPG